MDEIKNAWKQGGKELFSKPMERVGHALTEGVHGPDIDSFIGRYRIEQSFPARLVRRKCPQEMSLGQWVPIVVAVLASEPSLTAGRDDTYRVRDAVVRYLDRVCVMDTPDDGGDAASADSSVGGPSPKPRKRRAALPPPPPPVEEPEPDDDEPSGPAYH